MFKSPKKTDNVNDFSTTWTLEERIKFLEPCIRPLREILKFNKIPLLFMENPDSFKPVDFISYFENEIIPYSPPSVQPILEKNLYLIKKSGLLPEVLTLLQIEDEESGISQLEKTIYKRHDNEGKKQNEKIRISNIINKHSYNLQAGQNVEYDNQCLIITESLNPSILSDITNDIQFRSKTPFEKWDNKYFLATYDKIKTRVLPIVKKNHFDLEFYKDVVYHITCFVLDVDLHYYRNLRANDLMMLESILHKFFKQEKNG